MNMPSSVLDSSSMSTSAVVAQAVNGSHVLKIDGYSRIKGLGNDKFITSDPFDVGGHEWVIKYYPYSDGETLGSKGLFIAFFLHLNHSRNNLGTGVEASFSFSLLSSVAGAPAFRSRHGTARTFRNAETGWGHAKFIRRKTLEESGYLNNDCFRVRCDVTVWTVVRSGGIVPRCVAVPPSDMHRHIGALLESSQVGTDVTFHVGDETFAAHRIVLAARSPVFMAQLFGPMKEMTTCHVRIDDMEPRVFRAMLHFVYTDSLPEMVDGDDAPAVAQHLLVAADKYGMDRLKLICEDRLCDYINTDTAATTLVLAEQHGLEGLKEACFMFLKSPGNLKAVMAMDWDGFQHLIASCPILLSELLANFAP